MQKTTRRVLNPLIPLLLALPAVGCASSPPPAPACPVVNTDVLARKIARELVDIARDEAGRRAAGTGPHIGEGEPRGRPGAAADADDRLKVPLEDAPAKGASEPLVSIVVFSDFECPFCSKSGEVLDRVLAEYPDQVRIAFRHNPLPFHRNALPAAQAAAEAHKQGGDAKFWEMHDLLFANQSALGRSELIEYARAAGLDAKRFERALSSSAHQDTIDRDVALARKVGALGTPAHFVNGRMVVGAQPFEVFKEVIDEEIAIAERLLERGVSRERLYETILEKAREEAVSRPRPAFGIDDDETVHRVPVDGSPVLGPEDALVTLVVFSDFECPFCGRAQATLAKLREQYGDDIRIVFKHQPLPFHRNAMRAARASVEAFRQGGSEAFFRYHDILFANQVALGRDALVQYGRELGLDARRLARALNGGSGDEIIERDMKLATEHDAEGTPTFFINGRRIRGAQPLETFTAIVDSELEKARLLVRQGTPQARVYDVTLERGSPL